VEIFLGHIDDLLALEIAEDDFVWKFLLTSVEYQETIEKVNNI
jgi:hypothetical protein